MESAKEKAARIEHEEKLRGKPGSFPTVKVKADNDQGFMMINEHDFDPEVHEKVEDEKPTAAAVSSRKKKPE